MCGDRKESYGFDLDDYLYDSWLGMLGFEDSVVGAAGGLVNSVMNPSHPSQSAMDAMDAIAHLGYTLTDIRDAMATAWDSGPRGQGQVIGGFTIGS